MQGHELEVYRDILVVLTVAAVVVPYVERFKISPVLGYLLAGAILGPRGLGALTDRLWPLAWVTVADEKNLATIGEIGVVLLLFLIGLELSLTRLITMRRLIFGLGWLQVALSAAVIGSAAYFLGASPEAATVIGLSLALSSTAIVVEVLSRQQRLPTASGRAAFAILLAQDLAVVPLLLLATMLGSGKQGSIVAGLMMAFAQAALAIGFIFALGSVVLKPLFRLVASSANVELFVAATLLVAVGSGLLTASAGLSMALGAFIGGLLLAETEFRRAIETTLDPFKGLLLGVFFFTVGMSLDLGALLSNPLPILLAVAALVAVKAAIVAPLMRLFGFRWPVAAETSLLIGPGGEFAFIVIGMAMTFGIVAKDAGAFVLAVTATSMALIPVFDICGQWLSGRLEEEEKPNPALAVLPSEEARPRAIVIGYGRVGQLVSDMLSRHDIAHVVTERSPVLVSEARAAGKPVYFGDGRNPQYLARCGLKDSAAVIITIHTWVEIDDLVAAVRSERPDIVIVARARDAEHARHLYDIGVTDAVPETIEASLQLSEAALVGIGVPTGPVIASIHEKRDEFRETLQKAAGQAGKTTRALRAKAGAKKAGRP